ncbi:MAG: class I SAM-dependent methyltransferase [Thermodesulfobacteriota bacterium]
MDQLRDHYEIERELAGRLRSASREERRTLYTSLYDELCRRVPLHPQLTRKSSPRETAQAVRSQMGFLGRFLNQRDITFLEVGPGDCALSLEVARSAKQVYAVDVSSEIVKGFTSPPNFRLVISDGSRVPVPPVSVDVAYSNQLMEHLHPDDAWEQLNNIYRAIVPGGIYVCMTPNRLNGPHDVSRYFDEVATGFHLKEYTVSELRDLFLQVGFTKVTSYAGAKGIYIGLPAFLFVLYEAILGKLPHKLRQAIVGVPPFGLLLGIRLVGRK